MNELQGRVALVTGASRGIGSATALCLAEEAADVAINYRTHPEEAKEVVEKISKMGRRAFAYQGDVADLRQVHSMISKAVHELGGLDIVVANAGCNVRQPVTEA